METTHSKIEIDSLLKSVVKNILNITSAARNITYTE